MTKKVLLAAVGDYQRRATELKAAVPEIGRWAKLLTKPPYAMAIQGQPLTDATATRANILKGFEDLLANAQKDDQLLFVFVGHGSTVDGQQVLVAYPDGDPDLRKAMITYEDVAQRIDDANLPSGVDLTIVLDACFTEGFRDKGVVPLFARVAARELDFGHEHQRILRFSSLASLKAGDRRADSLVVVSAAREDQPAYQVPIGKVDRMLFSFRAIDRLRRFHETFADLEQNIRPLRRGFPQEAAVYGSPERLGEKFPGEADSAQAKLQKALDGTVTEPPLTMRILGLGCFILPAPDGEPFQTRLVLPYDWYGSGDMKHFAFIEVPEADIVGMTGNLPHTQYQRGGVSYFRWTLTEHRAIFANAVAGQPFSRSTLFNKHVPSLPKVTPELTQPRDECRLSHPDSTLFSAFIDFFGGSVDIGDLETVRTFFIRRYGGTPTNWGPEYTPRFVNATVPFTGDHAILMIDDISATTSKQIFIRPGAMIMAGNAREEDITGNGSGMTDPEHFLIYYNLADPTPLNPGIPTTEAVPIDACSVTTWP